VNLPLSLTFCSRVLVLLLLAATARLKAENWPRFLGPAGTGHSTETGLLSSWGEQGPPILWTKTIGTGYSAPSVVGGRLVVYHRIGDEEIVECLEAATGSPVWKHSTPTSYQDPYGYNNGPRCTPLLTTNRCYTFGAEGRLQCLDLGSGALIWERLTGKDWVIPEAFFGVGSTPLLESNLLIVMLGGQPNSGVVALEPGTGKTVWESVGDKSWTGVPMTGWPGERTVAWRQWDKQASYASPVAATVHGARRIYCLMRQGLVSINPQNGVVDDSFWFRARVEESVNAANPVVVDNQVLITAAYYKVGAVLLAAQSNSFKLKPVWRDTVLETHWSTPIYHDGHLFAFSGRNEPDARFRCVDFKTGKLLWDRDESWPPHSTPTPKVYGRGSLIAADGKLIVLGEGGLLGLFRLNAERSEELARWQVPQLRHPCWVAPVLSNQRLFLRGEKQLICLNLHG